MMDLNTAVGRIQLVTHLAQCECLMPGALTTRGIVVQVSGSSLVMFSDSAFFSWWDGGRYIGTPGAATMVLWDCAKMAPYRDRRHWDTPRICSSATVGHDLMFSDSIDRFWI
jgi:hypothetical protein